MFYENVLCPHTAPWWVHDTHWPLLCNHDVIDIISDANDVHDAIWDVMKDVGFHGINIAENDIDDAGHDVCHVTSEQLSHLKFRQRTWERARGQEMSTQLFHY